jgi:arylsulfatase A-like enzyme
MRHARIAHFTVAAAGMLTGCHTHAPTPPATRLVDLYAAESVTGRAPGRALPRMEWRFDAPAPPSKDPLTAARGWEAGPGVASLAVKDGRLHGQTTDAIALLHLERKEGLEDRDLIDAVEVKARVSGGGFMRLAMRESEKLDLKKAAEEARTVPFHNKVPLTPGPDLKTYVFSSRQFTRGVAAAEARHLLLAPTDAKGATFDIESVRLVTRREALAAVPSGIGWQGLAEIYRETVVARAPEVARFKLRLPENAFLDLAIGTIDPTPVTFRVSARYGSAPETPLLERTVTTPQRWEEAPIDLAPWAGEEVTLTLALTSDTPGAIGFWGSPAIRSHGAPPPGSASQPPQGVILIWSDTTRRDHLSVYGYARDTTPVLRRMAAEGALFEECIGQATWTKVATPSLMTSLYPLSHGVHDFSDRVPSAATTIAEVYRDAGFATLSLSSILFTGRFSNLHQGFEQVHEDASLPDRESSKTARVYVDRLLPWLEAHRDVPFFVFLHVSDPHDPYRPPPPYDTLWNDPAKREEHEQQARHAKDFIKAPLLKLFGMPDREEMKQAGFDPDAYVAYDTGWYDGSIRGMDVEIGRLLEGLKTLGLERKTLVVYTGDHGEEFLEHGRTFHGQTTYGELSNVPLIFWRPGELPGGVRVKQTVETIDLMPTLLEMSGLPVPQAAQGHSFLSLIAPGAPGATVRAASDWIERPAMIEKAVTSEPIGAPPPQDTESYAIVSGGFKLIHNTKRPAGTREFELYDHAKDPLDAHDVAAEHPDVVERLARELEAWHAKASAAKLPPDAAATQQMSPEQLDRLRALGYVQ